MPEQYKVDPAVSDFIQTFTKIQLDGDWYYIPRWFKKIGDDVFESYTAKELPQPITDIIIRNSKNEKQ